MCTSLIIHLLDSLKMFGLPDTYTRWLCQSINEWNAAFFFLSSMAVALVYAWLYASMSVRLREYHRATLSGLSCSSRHLLPFEQMSIRQQSQVLLQFPAACPSGGGGPSLPTSLPPSLPPSLRPSLSLCIPASVICMCLMSSQVTRR